MLGDSIEATKTIDEDKLAEHLRKTTFKTVVGDVKFGNKGEWAEERMMVVQFRNIKGNTIGDISDLSTQAILYPPQYKSGDLIYPYEKARQ